MKENIRLTVTQVLANYLESNHLRRTPERFAILDAVYRMNGHFTLQELDCQLVENNFRVSRATLYNTLNLLTKLRLVVCHRLTSGTKYEACYANNNHCHQICTMCGKVSEVKSPEIVKAVEETRLRRFHRDGFTMYIYGICSTCQAKQTRHQRKTEKSK